MSSKRILIVDDEPSILVGMKSYFCSRGYEVHCASEREEAEALVSHVSYACIIADMCLTEGYGADGLNVVGCARSLQPQTPVVVLTAYGSPATEAAAGRQGATAFLPKPQPLERLAEIVSRLLQGEQ